MDESLERMVSTIDEVAETANRPCRTALLLRSYLVDISPLCYCFPTHPDEANMP